MNCRAHLRQYRAVSRHEAVQVFSDQRETALEGLSSSFCYLGVPGDCLDQPPNKRFHACFSVEIVLAILHILLSVCITRTVETAYVWDSIVWFDPLPHEIALVVNFILMQDGSSSMHHLYRITEI